ncbi:methylated-DNA--[protein]-cysteine S-methyltransferase [Paenalcaligenes hominis]|uniref:methylated-DNA--[protein]-cysteine S-methyltransferase n=1 Tax=Paenalcaligenes hominis TaxID=643674 RepID=UPI003525CAB8
MAVLDLYEERLATPLGELIVLTDRAGRARAVDWADYHARMQQLLTRQYANTVWSVQPASTTSSVTQALAYYFSGQLDALEAVPCVVQGTPFQERVWAGLRHIPCGTTWSYKQLAEHIQHPKALRAVGTANGANPISVIIPCHRVVGTHQQLGGYAGGLERKRWLLQHEGLSF